MAETPIRVSVVGTPLLTRDVFVHLMADAGFDIVNVDAPPADSDVVVLVSDADEPARLLNVTNTQRVVVVAEIEPNDDAVAELVMSGAGAVINLSATPQDLADAVRIVATGGSGIASRPARRVSELARANQLAASSDRPALTKRDRHPALHRRRRIGQRNSSNARHHAENG